MDTYHKEAPAVWAEDKGYPGTWYGMYRGHSLAAFPDGGWNVEGYLAVCRDYVSIETHPQETAKYRAERWVDWHLGPRRESHGLWKPVQGCPAEVCKYRGQTLVVNPSGGWSIVGVTVGKVYGDNPLSMKQRVEEYVDLYLAEFQSPVGQTLSGSETAPDPTPTHESNKNLSNIYARLSRLLNLAPDAPEDVVWRTLEKRLVENYSPEVEALRGQLEDAKARHLNAEQRLEKALKDMVHKDAQTRVGLLVNKAGQK